VSAAADGGAAYVVEMLDLPDGTVKRRVRAKTVSIKRLSKRDLAAGAAEFPASINAEYARPQTREDCLPGGCNEARPCPFVRCKYHLYLDVNERTGSIKMNFPDLEVQELPETCALDVADRGGVTLEDVGELNNKTRERIRQIEVRAIAKIRANPATAALADYLEGEIAEGDNARTYATPIGVRNTGEGR
jgi:hypothetical protein